MIAQRPARRYRIGEHVVEFRAPRLADAESWRRTNLEHERRLRPAFGSPDTDWDAEHSPAAWASTWWSATRDPDVRIARVLTLADGAGDHVRGYQAWAGREPRTGHAEASTWIAGIPNSPEVTVYFTATCVLEMFRAHPDLPFVVAPMAVHNRPPIALAEAVGFRRLQTLRGLREYDGRATDHVIHYLDNTAASRAALEAVLASIDAEPLPAAPPLRPSRTAVQGLIRHGARELRARAHRAAGTGHAVAGALAAEPSCTEGGHRIEFRPAPGGFEVSVDGRPIGHIGAHVDDGSSTTELIDRLHRDADPECAGAALTAACRAAARGQSTRRLTVALADRHAGARDALGGMGFFSEGATLPTLGDEGTPRETWTRLRER